jgi:hypothetical protein
MAGILDIVNINMLGAVRVISVEQGEDPRDFTTGFTATPIYYRQALPVDATRTGPCIVEQMDTTTVVPPQATLCVDALGASTSRCPRADEPWRCAQGHAVVCLEGQAPVPARRTGAHGGTPLQKNTFR